MAAPMFARLRVTAASRARTPDLVPFPGLTEQRKTDTREKTQRQPSEHCHKCACPPRSQECVAVRAAARSAPEAFYLPPVMPRLVTRDRGSISARQASAS